MHATALHPAAAPAPAAVPAAPAVPDPAACANCDTARVGEYCHGCGQHFLDGRLTIPLLLRDLAERVTVERGLLRTIRDMSLDPGTAIADYLDGRRRRYVGPFTYLFFGAAVSLGAYQFYRHRLDAWMQERMSTATAGEHPLFTPGQAEAYAETMMSLTRQTAYTGLFVCVVFALCMALMFRRSLRVPEAFVFSLYVFGQAFIAHAVLVAPWYATVDRMDVFLGFNFLVYPVVGGYAAIRMFGRPVVTLLKVSAALAAGYLAFGAIVGGAVIVYVLHAVP